MYDASPDGYHEILNYEKTKMFLEQFDWNMINAFGFYGGEPSIDTDLYDKYVALVPDRIPKFVITNGTWSVSPKYTELFINWCALHQFHIIVSSTPEHIKYQHRLLLENLAKEFKGSIELKKPDAIHAQGRAKEHLSVISDCGLICQRSDRNIRLGLKPDGKIVFQNCHGEYHIVQTYNEPFDGMIKRTREIVDRCITQKSGNEAKGQLYRRIDGHQIITRGRKTS